MPSNEANRPPEVENDQATPGKGWPRHISTETAFLLALVGAAFLVRLWPLWQVHFWDAAVYLQNAEVICCGKLNYSELNSRPPLLSVLFAAVFRVWHHVYAASLVTALLNACGALFLYLGGRKLVGRLAAALAALLLAFSPFFVTGDTGNSLLTDSPALTLILICFWLLLGGAERDSDLRFALAGVVGALAVLMRFASLPSVAILSLLLLRAPRWLRAALWFGAGSVLGFVPYLLWSRVSYGGFLYTLLLGWRSVSGSTAPPTYYLQNFGGVFPWVTLVGLVLWLAALFLGKRAQWKGPGWASLFLWVWALALLVYFSALAHKELRYILPLAPPLFLLAGQGLTTFLPPTGRRRAIGAGILAVALAYSFASDLDRFRGPLFSPFVSEEKEVSDFLDSHAKPGAVLYTNFNYPVFAYYTHLPTRVLFGHGESVEKFYKTFPKDMPDDGYLVLYKQLDADPRLDWADSDPHFRRFQEFPSLVVYEYQAKLH